MRVPGQSVRHRRWRRAAADPRLGSPVQTIQRTSCLLIAFVLLAAPQPAQANTNVTFRYASYSPDVVRVAPGETVTWSGDAGSTFDQLTGHPLRFDDPAIAPQLSATSSTTRTFGSIGRFTYFCVNHRPFNMTG